VLLFVWLNNIIVHVRKIYFSIGNKPMSIFYLKARCFDFIQCSKAHVYTARKWEQSLPDRQLPAKAQKKPLQKNEIRVKRGQRSNRVFEVWFRRKPVNLQALTTAKLCNWKKPESLLII
jgi:hypothetical protein